MSFDFLGLVIILVVVLVSMVLHELTHGVVALALGDTTAKDDGRLTLNPLKHIDPYMSILIPVLLYLMGGPIFGGAKPVPVDSRRLKGGAWGMALVAVAGPLMNFLLAFIGFLIAWAAGVFVVQDGELLVVSSLAGEVFQQIVLVNLGFGIFNLIPIPPLDGSRVIYAIAPDGARRVMESMEAFGVVILMVVVVVFEAQVGKLMSNGIYGLLDLFCGIVS